jgi:hypothetical protein
MPLGLITFAKYFISKIILYIILAKTSNSFKSAGEIARLPVSYQFNIIK